MKLKINKEYEKLLPDLADDEYQSLKESIRESGIRVKLQVLKDGTVICGHNRYRIANELKITAIPYEAVDMPVKTISRVISSRTIFSEDI